MLLLKASQVEKSFQDRKILKWEELSVYEGEKIGLVGRNGGGKTTLLRILCGELLPEKGKIIRNCGISYFRQFDETNQNADYKLLKEMQVSEKAYREKVSGGENTRIRLADVFSKDAHITFFDEPTSNLDRKGIELLKRKLEKIRTFILISHDRDLLDDVCTRIIEVEDTALFFYNGNYSDYLEQKMQKRKTQEKEYQNYCKEKQHLQESYEKKVKRAKEVGVIPKDMDRREANLRNFLASRPFNVKQKNVQDAAKAIESRINQLQVKEKPKELSGIKLDFRLTQAPENKMIIRGENISFSYGEEPLIQNLNFEIVNGSKTAIAGDNGSGKTTLLNLIYNGYAGIKVVPRAKIGYFHQTFEQLDFEKTVIENVMKDSIQKESVARTMLARLLLKADDIGKKVSVLSGGELVKLSIAKLLVSDANVLFLDEPTNYLDISSLEALQEVLSNYEGTLLFISHDKIFTEAIATHQIYL